MSRQQIRDAFLGVAQLRDGGKELFDICDANAVPSIVLSAGIKDVIQIIAEHYEIRPTHILSTSLVFDEQGNVRGWDRRTLVHMLNKRERGHTELTMLQRARPNIILLGDVPDDVHMANGDDNVLRIRVLDSRPGETFDRDTLLNTTFAAGYDLAIDHSLAPVVNILKRIVTKL
jgi:2-hydroxy-3-keto-5-methylthiopentenyl-1-phosphate phosphatase